MNELSVLRSVTRDPAILAASLLANLLSLAVPLAMLQIYDRVIPNAAHETLIVLAIMVSLALAVDCALRISRARLLSFFTARFEQIAYTRAFWSLIMENPSERERVDSGTLMTRISAIDRLRSQKADGAATALLDLPFAALFLVVMAFLSPFVAGAVAATLVATVISLGFLRRRINMTRKARLETDARKYSFVSEVLSNIRSVRALKISDLMSRRQERLLGRSANQTRDMTRRVHMAQGLTAAIGNLIPIITATSAGYMVFLGQASIGVLAAVVVLSGRIVQPVLRVEGYLAGLESSRQSEADLRAITDLPLRRRGSRPLKQVETLVLRNVTTHPDPEFGIRLEGIDVSLRKGDCLLLRDDDPVRLSVATRLFLDELTLARGEILINGRALSTFMIEDRQDRIRLLSEEARLLYGTVFENICAFRPDRHRDVALDLAKELGLLEIMRSNPRGVQALVREDMDGLPHSAQRIASNISGLVTLPDVVVFHLANSGLDIETDRRLLDWLKHRAPHHILILVTNRPSYMSLATKILDVGATTETLVVTE